MTVKNSDGQTSLAKTCFITVNPNLSNSINPLVALDKNYPSGYGGDPVNAATGAFTFSMKDISLFSFGREMSIERRYNSQNLTAGMFGKGWAFEYETWLDLSNPFQWELHHGDGHSTYHVPYGGGETKSLYPGMLDSLYYIINGGTNSYVYLMQTGEKKIFDSQGRLLQIIDLNENTISCHYTNGKLDQLIVPGGRKFTITTNNNNRISKIVNPIGDSSLYFYSGTSDLQLDSARTGQSTTSFYYNATGIIEIYDPNGNRAVKTLYHPTTKKAIRQYDALDNSTDFDYQAGGLTIITDANSKQKKLTHDNSFRLVQSINEISATKKYSYTSDNQIETLTDERNYSSHFYYDSAGNLTKTKDAQGFEDSLAYGLYSRPKYIKDANGGRTNILYDLRGNAILTELPNTGSIQRFFDNRGLDTLVIDAEGNETRKTYSDFGDLVTLKTPEGITSFYYDLLGRIIARTNGKGYTDSLAYNYFNQVVRTVDPLGAVSLFNYDRNGNLVSIIDKEGNKTNFVYDNMDRLIKTIKPRNHVTAMVYDELGRMIKSRDENGNATLFTYNDAGRLIAKEDSVLGLQYAYGYDKANNLTSVTDRYGKTRSIEYDERNLPIKYTDPLNYFSTLEYDGNKNLVKRIDEEGRITRYRYNEMGLRTTVIDAGEDSITADYDLNGNLETLIDARGNARHWTFDAANRMKTFNDGFGDYQYFYDSIGQLTRFKDRAGNTLNYQYTAVNDLKEVNSQNGLLKNFEYSPNGWLKTAATPVGVITYLRNELGWPLEVKGIYNDKTEYQYDSIGNIAQITYPDGKNAKYVYNSLNKANKVVDWSNQDYILHRDLLGRLDSISYPNRCWTTYSRDDASRIISWKDYASGIPPPIHENYVTRDRTGYVVRDSGVKVLNPQIDIVTSFGTYGTDDRIQSYGSYVFEHDGSGNRIKAQSPIDTIQFSYNPEGLLSTKNHRGIQSNYTYDPLKNRIQQSSTLQTNRYTLDNEITERPLVLSEWYGSIQVANNLYTPDGTLLARDSSGTWHYYQHDLYGNTVTLSNNAGKITDRYAYGPFGDFYTHVGTSSQPYTFLGQYGIQQDDSSLYYIWARYYDAMTGKFLAKDPQPFDISSTQSINRYTYGLNNPLMYVDVNGMFVNNTSYDLTWYQNFATSDLGLKAATAFNFLASGNWLGTGLAQNAYSYYENQYIKSVVNGIPNYWIFVGLGFSSLWTPDNYQKTLGAFTLKTDFSGKKLTELIGKTGRLKIVDMRTTVGQSLKALNGGYNALKTITGVYKGFYE